MKKRILCLLLGCSILFSGCNINRTSSQPSLEIDVSKTTLESTSSFSNEPTPSSSTDKISSEKPLVTFDSETFEEYLNKFVLFFHAPVEDGANVKKDYYFSYFLLYQAYYSSPKGAYQQNADYFWQIPITDIQQIAEQCFGIKNLDISEIEEWPFPPPENGYCYFTTDTSLPYVNANIIEVSFDQSTKNITANVQVLDDQFEDSSGNNSSLRYQFEAQEQSHGYRLVSIGL